MRDDVVVQRLWQLHRRGVSYASSVPAVNLLLADLSEGLREAANLLTNHPAAQVSDAMVESKADEWWYRRTETARKALVKSPDHLRRLAFKAGHEAALFTTSPRYEGLVEALTHARECLKANGYGDHTVAIVMIDQALASVSIEGVGK
jgi:hypothetical protein